MTAAVSHRTPARFELATAKTWADPWSMYQALRDHDPVHHVVPEDRPDHDYWVLSRHADIWNAARDNATFSSAQGLTVNYGELEMIGLADNPPMVMQDPPTHTEFRKLVSRGFTPRQVEAVEPAVRQFVVDRIERLRADGERRHRRRTVQAAAVDGRRALPRRARGGPRAVRRLDRCDRRRPTRSEGGLAAAGETAGEAVGVDDGLLHRADRTSPPRTRGRHRVAPRRRGRRRRRRHRRACCRSSPSHSRWSPAATTPPPACSAARCNCCTSGPISAGC